MTDQIDESKDKKILCAEIYKIDPTLKDSRGVEEFLSMFDPPDKLKGLLPLTKNFLSLAQNWNMPGDQEKWGLIKRSARLILDNSTTLILKMGSHIQAPIKSHKTFTPLYQLYNLGCRPQITDIYSILLVHTTNAYSLRKNKCGHSLSTLYGGCEALWALADQYETENALGLIPIKNYSGHELASELFKLRDNRKIGSKKTNKLLKKLGVFIGQASGRRRKHKREGTTPSEVRGPDRGYKLQHALLVNSNFLPDEPEPWIGGDIEIFGYDWPEKDEIPGENNEDYGQHQIALIKGVLAKCSSEFAANMIIRAQGQNAQTFRFRKNQLTSKELCVLSDNILASLDQNPEAGLLLFLMLIRGLDTSNIHGIKLIPDSLKLANGHICILANKRRIFFPALTPQRKANTQRNHDSHYETEMPDIFWEYLPCILDSDHVHIFFRRPSTYTKLVKHFLDEINKNTGLLISLQKIKNHLRNIGQMVGIDDVLIAQIRHDMTFETSPKLAYTRTNNDKLNQSYRKILSHFFYEKSDHPLLTISTPPRIECKNHCIGDSKSMSISETSDFFTSVKKVYANTKRSQPSQTKFIYMHNIYTSYALLVLGFTTAFRGNNDPLQNINLVDIKNHVIFLADKNTANEYRSRTVYAPSVLIDQLLLYDEFRKQSLIKLINFDLHGYSAYRENFHPEYLKAIFKANRSQNGPDLKKTNILWPETCFPYFFFISWDGSIESVSMGDWLFKIGVKDISKDSGRHFLRSELVQRNCPSEVINAYMGHWQRGAESYGTMSTLSPKLVRDAIQPFIDQIIDAAGIKALNP